MRPYDLSVSLISQLPSHLSSYPPLLLVVRVCVCVVSRILIPCSSAQVSLVLRLAPWPPPLVSTSARNVWLGWVVACGSLGVVFGARRGAGLRSGIVESVCGRDGVAGGPAPCTGCATTTGILRSPGACGMFDGAEEAKAVAERGLPVRIRVVAGSVCG